MKNYFCVGQKVIREDDRKITTLIHVSEKFVIDSENNTHFLDQIKPLQDYQDPTNYFYHHSRFATGQEMADDGFRDLMFILAERDDLISFELTTGSARPKFHTFLNTKQQEAESMIEKGLLIKRTAEHNLNQWGSGRTGKVLAQHLPFLNPENCTDYVRV